MQKIRNFSLDQAVRATAGAGKTTGLISAVESCYKSHLQSKGVVPYILLTTFTIKAANELSERILDYALKKEDKNFLSYVSSHYLEIGTMHSTFMKVLSHISNEEIEENLKSFESTKLFHAKRLVHKVVKQVECEEVFDLIGDDKDLARFFIRLFESNYLDLNFVTADDIAKDLIKRLVLAIDSGPELFVENVKNAFDEVEGAAFENTESLFKSLKRFRETMLFKVSQKCKRDEKAYYRSILKIIQSPDADESFLSSYAFVHENILTCYKLWKPEYEELLETKLGFGISDIEWRLFKDLESKDEDLDLWDFCFFDEYQDTNPIQKRVIERLTKNTPCYFVGDPFQSIYYFRGARKSIFLNDFDEVKKQGGSAEFRLDNYRSSFEVVDFVNTVCIDKLPGFKSMVSRKDLQGEVVVFHNEEATLNDELSFIYSKIKGVDLAKDSFAILSRNAKELMLCARFLKSKKIDVSVSLSKSFENSLEIIDLCSVLRFLHYPNDNMNFLGLMRSPWFNISDSEIQSIVKAEKTSEEGFENSYWGFFKETRTESNFHKLLSDFEVLNSNEALVNFLVYSSFIDSTNFLDATGKRELNIWKFIGILQAEEDRPEFDAGAFIHDIIHGLYPLEKDSSEPDSGCLLMTVHASKGLQFDHVVILAANKSFSHKTGNIVIDEENKKFGIKVYSESDQKKMLPEYFGETLDKDKIEVAEESRRLLYVAMTRAVKNLYISGSGAISKNPYEPSWLKIILDFQSENKFTLIKDIGSSLNVADNEQNQGAPMGFMLNKSISEIREESSTAVTKVISSDFNHINLEKKSATSLSKLSSNIVRGTLFHEFIERSGANGDLESKVNNFFEYEVDENHLAFKYLVDQEELPFNELMDCGEKEWGFDFINKEDVFSSGKIDLWGVFNDELWIVDFKTGQTKFLEKGFKQLEFYQEVLKEFLGKADIKTKLVLTFPFKKLTKIKEV